jgi:hypothetical protein
MTGVFAPASRSSARRRGRVAVVALAFTISGCHAIKVQLGMNAGASTSSAPSTPTSTSSSSSAASGQASSGKKAHLGGGGGDKGPPALLETLGRGSHDGHGGSGFDATPYDVSPPRFVWRSHSGSAQDRQGKRHF